MHNKMELFISWSGKKSCEVAKLLRDWIPSVIQSVKPWMSSEDIHAGQRWGHELAVQLEKTNFGLICVTRENYDKPWLHFEAGSLAKSIGDGYVIPLLFDVRIANISGPFAQFQAKEMTKDGMQAVIESIHSRLPSPSVPREVVLRSFEVFWPALDKNCEALHKSDEHTQSGPVRSDRELLEEILASARRGNTVIGDGKVREILAEIADLRAYLARQDALSKPSEALDDLEKATKEMERRRWQDDYDAAYVSGTLIPPLLKRADELRARSIAVIERLGKLQNDATSDAVTE
jgi:hypothetical protein